jgi:hypothetical protein
MKRSSLSFWLIFVWHLSLSDMSIATSVCFQGLFVWKIFSHLFIPSQCLSLSLKSVSCKQQMVKYCFLIQPAFNSFDLRIDLWNLIPLLIWKLM